MWLENVASVPFIAPKFIALCAILLSLWYVASSWKRRRMIRMIDEFNGPPKLPVIGNLHYCIRSQAAIINSFLSWANIYASPFRIWMGWKPYLIVTTPDDIQVVLNETLDKGKSLHNLKVVMGEGLVTVSSLEKWRKNRRTINSNFNASCMWQQFLNSFNEDARCLLDQFKKRLIHKKEMEVHHVVNSIALKSICRTAMGYSATEEELMIFGRKLENELAALTMRYYIPFIQPDFAYNLFKFITGNRSRVRDVFELPRKIIAETRRKNMVQKENPNEPEGSGEKTGKNVTLMNILLEENSMGRRLSEQEIVDEVITFLIGGTETVSVAISNTLLMLAIHEDIQEKLYGEIFQVFGNDDREPTMDDLDKLHYLEQCLKETMRLLPSIPIIFRESSKEIVLANRLVPKNTTLAISIIAVHRDKNIYAKPYEWNPDNFTSAEVAKRHKYGFIPFSAGAKMCLGYKYAMMSMKINVVAVIRKYRLRSNLKMEDIAFNIMMVMKVKNGYVIEFIPRTR